MAEFFFIATTLFVAYVVFVVMADKKELKPSDNAGSSKVTMSQAEPSPVSTVSVEPKTVASSHIISEAPKTDVADTKLPIDSIRNPKTGEIAKIPNNYSFAKRWIKEALVTEGLLDKVYKNADLNDEVNAKIHAALQQLKEKDNYQ